MNKHIEELAVASVKIDLEKFAKLIVMECADWINNHVGMVDDDARADLLKHFGIEQ
jgi:hypothetical protein